MEHQSPSGVRRRLACPIPTVEEESDGFTLRLTEVQTKESSANKRRWGNQTNPQVLMSSFNNFRLPNGTNANQNFFENELEDE
jgi:hypothetical protein